MSAIDLCLCILIVAGAFACICLGILFIKMLSTLEQVNMTLMEAQKSLDKANVTIETANKTIDDVNYKLDLLNAPFEKVNGFFNKTNNNSMLNKTAGIVGAYRAGRKSKK